MLLNTIVDILTESIQPSYGVQSFVTVDPKRNIIILTRKVGQGVNELVYTEAIIRLEEGRVIIEYDDIIEHHRLFQHAEPTEGTIAHTLIQAGIPREKIVLAYARPAVPV